MSRRRFEVGDKVRMWKPGYVEHGVRGTVFQVKDRDPGDPPWKGSGQDISAEWYFGVELGTSCHTVGDYMVVHEKDFQR